MSEETLATAASEMADQPVPSRAMFALDLGGVAIFGSAAGYALGYAAQDSFFGAFGLTPDQVGVDNLTGLLRITPLAVIFGFGLACVFLLGVCAGGILDLHRLRWWPANVSMAASVPFLILLAITMIGLVVRLPSDPTFDAARSVLVGWMVAAGVWGLVTLSGNARMASFAAALAVVTLGMFLLYNWMPVGAKTLREAGIVRERLTFIGIRSGYVDVRWHDPQRRPPELAANQPGRALSPPPQTVLPRLLIVLNQSGGTYTLWDCTASRIYTVRDADAEVVRNLPARVDGPVIAAWTGCTG